MNPWAFSTAVEFVLAFYRAIGWDPSTHTLDPTRMRMHPETWKRYAGLLIRRHGTAGGLTWMTYGPSGLADGCPGRARLVVEDGWLRPVSRDWPPRPPLPPGTHRSRRGGRRKGVPTCDS